ncbi:hypothetical protein JKF63_01655 [Porcisia hertigi]|uniref:Uncharacterized protein n=1 Tax=Porcisia hertigi TaxID=2761500 RepID=A0A836LB13_9TRYP|nr:hypothetical protein JKF63_01655 [Porcisia hertigi]
MSTSNEKGPVSQAYGIHSTPPTNARGSKLSTLSVGELRTAMQQHLRSTGALRQLKTQLRGMVITELLQQPKTARMLIHGTPQSVPPSPAGEHGKLEDRKSSAIEPLNTTPSIAATSGRRDQTLQTWSCGLADALVENHLRRTRRAMSLSIFSTEAEVPPFSVSGAPSEEEEYLAHLFQLIGVDAPVNPEDDILTPSSSHSAKSVLQRLVEDCVARQGSTSAGGASRHLHHCSTQTDAADSADHATNPLNSLECRLAAVDAKYALTFSQLKQTRGAGEQPFFLRSEVERRLQQYKNDMHAQLRSEYEQKYNSFARVKLQEARDDAEGRYRVLLQSKTEELAEMERSVVVKLEQERQRLKTAWEDVHQQRTELERRQRDTMKQLSEYDAARQRSDTELHSWKEKTRALQLQCSKWEELCGTRLMELDGARSREGRRVEDIRRLQAEHAAELRLKDEEISRLRYRLRLASRNSDSSQIGAAPEASADQKYRMNAAVIPPLAQPGNVTSLLSPQQPHSLHLRAEELPRNVSEPQQERWDAAWVAAAAAGPADPATDARQPTTAMPSAERVFAELQSSTPAPASQATLYPSPSWQVQAVQCSDHHSADPDEPVAAASLAPTAAVPSAACQSVSTPPSSREISLKPAATATAAVPLSIPSDELQQKTALSKKTPSTGVSSTLSSSSVSSTRATLLKAASAPAIGTPVTQSSASSGAHKSSSPASAPPSAAAITAESSGDDADNEDSANRIAAAAARLNALAAEEEIGRGEVQSEEENVRNSILWLDRNRRELLADELKREGGKDGGGNNSVGDGVPSPWNQFGGGSLGNQLGGTAAAVTFNDSFSTDDSALLRDSYEDDSEF